VSNLTVHPAECKKIPPVRQTLRLVEGVSLGIAYGCQLARRPYNPLTRPTTTSVPPPLGTPISSVVRRDLWPSTQVDYSESSKNAGKTGVFETAHHGAHQTTPDPDAPHPQVTADQDLAAVIETWPLLPKAVRAGILAMVQAASG
jgi:hypothetical protein